MREYNVSGKTYQHRHSLKEMGGTWDNFTKTWYGVQASQYCSILHNADLIWDEVKKLPPRATYTEVVERIINWWNRKAIKEAKEDDKRKLENTIRVVAIDLQAAQRIVRLQQSEINIHIKKIIDLLVKQEENMVDTSGNDLYPDNSTLIGLRKQFKTDHEAFRNAWKGYSLVKYAEHTRMYKRLLKVIGL